MSAGLAALRRFARPRPAHERCELCAAALAEGHAHLLETGRRELRCACEGCAALFPYSNQRYRKLPARARRLDTPALDDAAWEALDIPIGLAAFCRRADGTVAGYYPSPAGAVESLLPLKVWEELSSRSPQLAALEPEVEAVLVRRDRVRREQFIVPMDQCFRLIGLVRANWTGFSGGEAAHAAVEDFFARLRETADPA